MAVTNKQAIVTKTLTARCSYVLAHPVFRMWPSFVYSRPFTFAKTLFILQDAFPNGEVHLGLPSERYSVSEDVTADLCAKPPPHVFVVHTPDRDYVFAADSEDDKKAWLQTLEHTISQPIGPQDDLHMLKIQFT